MLIYDIYLDILKYMWRRGNNIEHHSVFGDIIVEMIVGT